MFGLIILVHYLPPRLSELASLIAPGGYLFVETIGGHGDNWLELPPAGALKQALNSEFSICFYRERQVAKLGRDAASVQLLVKKCILGEPRHLAVR